MKKRKIINRQDAKNARKKGKIINHLKLIITPKELTIPAQGHFAEGESPWVNNDLEEFP